MESKLPTPLEALEISASEKLSRISFEACSNVGENSPFNSSKNATLASTETGFAGVALNLYEVKYPD